MIYETLLIIGALGLGVQALLGMGHDFAGHAHHGGHAELGSHDASEAQGHGAHAGHTGPHSHGNGASWLWALASPMALFSLCVGAGVTGVLVHTLLTSFWTAAAAVCGAVAFYGLLFRPIWNFSMRFASAPAKALQGIVASNAEAMGHFDAQGRGMVRVIIDGQVVRLLARLEEDDQFKGVTIAPGDQLIVTSVNGRNNSCRVTRL